MANILGLAWARYSQQLSKKPLPTKAVTAGCLSGASDILAQTLTSKGPINWRRTLAIAAFGFVWAGPSAHYWQAWLQKTFPKKDDKTLIKKVAVDQLTYGPICNLALMCYLALIVDGRSFDFTKQRLKNDFWAVQVNGWRFWPLVALFNYRYVPLKLRVLVINLAAFCWSTFLITRSNRKTVTVLRK
mmetsp:Transcript_5563/g.15941  ORF Transcript_5563/g.15941 Transcript_5563/m.15941 type:complete len:187 (+) Transcript_5563:226-786(+)